MFVNILLLIIGLILLVKGADFFVDGSSKIAKALKVPPLIIGLTLVSIGTSAPEISVNINSAILGLNDMAIGNVVGSNIFNTLLILGISALFIPLKIEREVKLINLPILLIVYLLFIIFCTVITPFQLDIYESIFLIFLTIDYLIFLIARTNRINKTSNIAKKKKHQNKYVNKSFKQNYSNQQELILSTKTQQKTLKNKNTINVINSNINTDSINLNNADIGINANSNNAKTTNTKKNKKEKPLWLSVILGIIGLIGVIFGGELVVNNASSLAKLWGMSESLVGLTIVSVGTSLPELVTSVMASIKKENDMAIGNIIGSNIFNIILILGLSSTISPLIITNAVLVDIIIMFLSAIIIFAISLFSNKINRYQGAILVLIYIAYLSFIIIRN